MSGAGHSAVLSSYYQFAAWQGVNGHRPTVLQWLEILAGGYQLSAFYTTHSLTDIVQTYSPKSTCGWCLDAQTCCVLNFWHLEHNLLKKPLINGTHYIKVDFRFELTCAYYIVLTDVRANILRNFYSESAKNFHRIFI